ncbi:MAG: HlyD family type I secretion periplasmic adaptor subunit [Rickettsiaceae bacterium]
MSEKKKSLTPEQLQQLQLLMMQQKQGGANTMNQPPGGLPQKPSKLTPKGMLIAILQSMQNGVKFIDQFINFIVKPGGGNANDVVKNARSPIMFGFFITLIFVFFSTIWAATAPLDSAAYAIGTVVNSSLNKIINHQEGGMIKEVYVKLGDEVKQGDKLIELDDTRTKSDYESIIHQYRTLLAAETRLLAEINEDDSLHYPEFLLKDNNLKDVKKIIETQNNLFASRRSLKTAEQNSLKQKTKQLHKQIDGFNAKKVSLHKTLAVIKERLDATKELHTKGFAQKSVLLDLEAKEANTQSEIAMTDTEIARSEQEITKTDIDLLNLDSKFTMQTLTELKEAQLNLAAAREKFFYLQDSLARVIIKSPVDGVVNVLNYHTVGSTIAGGQPIIEIAPKDDMLVIDAKIAPKLIDNIRTGLTAKIRFSAFKSRTTPLFTGTVVSLSPDIIRPTPGAPPVDQSLANGYYLARIELDMDNFEKMAGPRHLQLYPGMQAEVQIVTGTRTLLQYLLDPVYDAMFKGFKEK